MWPLILKQLPLILLATASAWMTHLYLEQRDATTTCQVSRDSEIKAAEAQRAAMEVRNKESLGKLNRDHAKQLADAISNARINWGTISLPSQSSVPSDITLSPDSACPSDEAVGQLLVNCATDANTIQEFQRWITLNRIPVAEDDAH